MFSGLHGSDILYTVELFVQVLKCSATSHLLKYTLLCIFQINYVSAHDNETLFDVISLKVWHVSCYISSIHYTSYISYYRLIIIVFPLHLIQTMEAA